MIWVDEQKLDTDLKAMQQIEFVEQLKNINGVNAVGTKSMFVLSVLKKKSKKHDQNFFKEVPHSYKRWQVIKKLDKHTTK